MMQNIKSRNFNPLENKDRIFYFDMLRAFAIFCIVSCHVFARLTITKSIFNTNLWYYAVTMNSLRDIGVPLFVMISGALLIGKNEPSLTFIKKRISRIILPYLFWMFAFIIFFHYVLDYSTLDKLIIQTVSLNPQGPGVFFWFVPMILTVYIVILIINKLYQKNRNTITIALILSLIVLIMSNFGFSLDKPMRYVLYAIFAVFGYYLATMNLDMKAFKQNKKLLAGAFLILSIGLYALEVYINTSTSISLNSPYSIPQFSFLNVICVISVFLFFRCFSEFTDDFKKLKKQTLGKIIFSIGICSYGIYLSHVILQKLLLKLLDCYKSDLNMSIFITGIFILTFLGSWILIMGLSKIPVINRISGL